MITSSILSVASLENSLDCSPDYYRPEYLRLSKQLRAQPFSKIRAVGYVTDGEHGSPDWDIHSGIRYIAAEHVLANSLSDAPMRMISAAQDARNARCRVQPNDILVYSVGAYAGLAARAEPHTFPASIPRSVAIIRLKSDAPFRAGFVAVFLNTEFGQFQTRRLRAGNSQPVLALEKIRQIELPHIPVERQGEVDQLYESAYQARQSGQRSYASAGKLLEAELGLDELTFRKPVGYTARFSDLEISHRSDAQHYQPRFRQLIDHISTFTSVRVRDIRTYNRRGLQPVYVENGLVDVVNSQHLGAKHIDYEGLEKTSAAAFAAGPEAQIQNNDLLIYTTGAYIGRTNIYLSEAPALASNHVNILRLQSGIDAAYMALVFQSIVGQFQTQKHASGSAQAELYPADIDRFVVPLLDANKQKAIGNLVRESLVKQQESRMLVAQAKARVEQLIKEAVQP
jgi:restriction endonuclease S subunit